MTGLVRNATLLAVCGLLVAGAATAGIPDPASSNINLGGAIIQLGDRTSGGAAVARCDKDILVRDNVPNPVVGAVVEIDFDGCYSQEIRLSTNQPFHPNAIGTPPGFNCASRGVSAVTDGTGHAHFRIMGSTTIINALDGLAHEGCATVTATAPGGPTIVLGTLSVAVGDLKGMDGMNGTDTTMYTGVRFGGASAYRSRCNYVGVAGTVDGSDTTAFSGYRNGDGAGTTNGPVCN